MKKRVLYFCLTCSLFAQSALTQGETAEQIAAISQEYQELTHKFYGFNWRDALYKGNLEEIFENLKQIVTLQKKARIILKDMDQNLDKTVLDPSYHNLQEIVKNNLAKEFDSAINNLVYHTSHFADWENVATVLPRLQHIVKSLGDLSQHYATDTCLSRIVPSEDIKKIRIDRIQEAANYILNSGPQYRDVFSKID